MSLRHVIGYVNFQSIGNFLTLVAPKRIRWPGFTGTCWGTKAPPPPSAVKGGEGGGSVSRELDTERGIRRNGERVCRLWLYTCACVYIAVKKTRQGVDSAKIFLQKSNKFQKYRPSIRFL